jgi:hypothetical protein
LTLIADSARATSPCHGTQSFQAFLFEGRISIRLA